ncbi:SpoIIE family protein phosphatase [Caldalkalibacillus salinus]|uniref:SpoIIE family protein phosphatase n=1 Tax=Caldalkalibacillus salinus TaxID=2803787 RepID=UPI001922077B
MIETKSYSKTKIITCQQSKHGELVCGDSYYTIETDEYFFTGVADGLGSGAEAKKASEQAVHTFREHHHQSLKHIVFHCNQNLQTTRGAVIGALKLDFKSGLITFAGVGNIQCLLLYPDQTFKGAISVPGYLSGRRYRMREMSFPFFRQSMFLMYSDGISIEREAIKRYAEEQDPEKMVQRILPPVETEYKDDLTLISGKYF